MTWLLLLLIYLPCVLFPVAFLFPCSDCCESCTIFQDPFTTDTIAADWTVESGSWTMGSGVLSTNSSTAVIVPNTGADGTITAVYATAVILCNTSTTVGRLIIARTDANNYWFMEVQPGATNGTLKLFQRSGGTNTQRGSTSTLFGYTGTQPGLAQMCYANGVVHCSFWEDSIGFGGFSGSVSYTATVTVASTKFGLSANGASSPVEFSNFICSKHKYQDAACPQCGGQCVACAPEGVDPVQIQVEISGMGSGGSCGAPCTGFDGTYILNRTTGCTWRYELSPTICAMATLTVTATGSLVGPNHVMSNLHVKFSVAGAPTIHLDWDETPVSDNECLEWDAHDVPENSSIQAPFYLCFPYGTCEITAL